MIPFDLNLTFIFVSSSPPSLLPYIPGSLGCVWKLRLLLPLFSLLPGPHSMICLLPNSCPLLISQPASCWDPSKWPKSPSAWGSSPWEFCRRLHVPLRDFFLSCLLIWPLGRSGAHQYQAPSIMQPRLNMYELEQSLETVRPTATPQGCLEEETCLERMQRPQNWVPQFCDRCPHSGEPV